MTLTRAICDQPLALTPDTRRAWNLYTPTDDRIGWPPRSHTRAYYERLLATGKTPREAKRCVKRTLARHFYHRLTENQQAALTT
jgi:hypothetical protein